MSQFKPPRIILPALHKRAFRRIVEFHGFQRIPLQQYRSRVRNLYDGPAGGLLMLASMVSLHQPLMGRVLKKRNFDLGRFRSILDVGSGAGQILGHLLKHTHPEVRVVACDLSPQMLRRARTRQARADSRPWYVAADLMHLPFADDAFDCVTCGYVLEYLPDPLPGLTELRRVLKPGGSLLLAATEDTYTGLMNGRMWRCRTFNRDELRLACTQAGLPW
ncbi:MAG TPA: class I SAM-dependent methyltransferase, partial [Planctomycetaceae bacterium]|nr:class I SAM-dependent methyltransferase [Planctomycetaceae bacterium]